MTTKKGSGDGKRPSRAALQHARLSGVQIATLKHALHDEDNPHSVDLASAAARLPRVTLPSLEGLEVEVPPARPPTDDEVEAALRVERARHTKREPRGRGAPIAAEDDVVVTFVGFEKGAPKPFAAVRGLLLSDVLDPLPGLREALVGCPVGESRTVKLDLPYAVRVDEAYRLVPVQLAVEEDELRVAARARAEKAVRAERLQLLENRVLDAVRARARVSIPADLVDVSIKGYWNESEGPALVALDIPEDEQRASLAAWQKDAAVRADVQRRLETTALVAAYVAARGLSASIDDVLERAGDVLRDVRGTPKDLRLAMEADPARARRAQEHALHVKAVEALTREVVGDAVVDELVAA